MFLLSSTLISHPTATFTAGFAIGCVVHKFDSLLTTSPTRGPKNVALMKKLPQQMLKCIVDMPFMIRSKFLHHV